MNLLMRIRLFSPRKISEIFVKFPPRLKIIRKNKQQYRKVSVFVGRFPIFFRKHILISKFIFYVMRNFKDLEIWKIAYEINIDVYKILPKLPEKELRNIFDQLQRAATSIALNIAEGSRSESSRKFFNYLHYAYASSAEVEVLLMFCADLGYIDHSEFKELWGKIDKFNAKLYSFMKAIFKDKIIDDNQRKSTVPFKKRMFSYGAGKEKGFSENGRKVESSSRSPLSRLAVHGEGKGKEKMFFR